MEVSLMEFVQSFTLPALILLVLGIVFLVIEMFTPGLGVFGLLGFGCLVGCIIIKAQSISEALWMIIILTALVGALLVAFLKSASKGKLSKTELINNEVITQSSGYIDMDDLSYFVGKAGKASTILRPAGIADFDGVRLDVVSNGGFIEAGEPVKVVSVEGRKIVVEKE